MVYIFDTSSFKVLGNYFPKSFPTVWQKIDLIVSEGKLQSVREVLKEVEYGNNKRLFGLCYAMDGGYKGWNPYVEKHLAIFVNCF
ncbi:DUF4411 family protein [Microcystis panniformis]|uniref:DUF4411 domain-containing protein n=1 Tax=Microcystis panniformis FACHB-1757 TaxID=1638788 RepID=A0A0K1S1W6_9CHRO|nr:DUF4411 family protein [Microcystis panniformis]AKV68008.1 hypothetical protein VL20_2972 [Microcystis panniformis FACHB-1757]REJ45260.1 MAG: DUF4411 family protein [Microcystis aeruginosa TA09]